ncbi:hypothetical protein AB0912_30750 [Streptomyces sp. NPDC007084]|uniref:hypothetical protein n=1 Tax=Streptomyces sp. NPDC007084 TaxID=3154313 RepID=UPI0034552289
MGEQCGRDWTQMTPESFGHDAPPRPTAEQAAVPAVPDACGTAPLFGEKTRTERRAEAPSGPAAGPGERGHQEALF